MTTLNGEYREELDKRIRRLVDVFSYLPGIIIYTSCGGHEEKNHQSQCNTDEFNVGFFVFVKKEGLSSLRLINRAAKLVDRNNIIIIPQNSDNSTNNLYIYAIYGFNGVSPDDFAYELEKCIKSYFQVTNINDLERHFYSSTRDDIDPSVEDSK